MEKRVTLPARDRWQTGRIVCLHLGEDFVKILTGEAILSGLELPTERVPVPELGGGGFVIVRGLTALERGKYEQALIRDGEAGKGKIFDPAFGRGELLARTIVDEQGQRVFTDADAGKLQALRGDVADRIFGVAKRLSGLNPEDFDELKKACGVDPSDASPSI